MVETQSARPATIFPVGQGGRAERQFPVGDCATLRGLTSSIQPCHRISSQAIFRPRDAHIS